MGDLGVLGRERNRSLALWLIRRVVPVDTFEVVSNMNGSEEDLWELRFPHAVVILASG